MFVIWSVIQRHVAVWVLKRAYPYSLHISNDIAMMSAALTSLRCLMLMVVVAVGLVQECMAEETGSSV